MTDLVVHTPGGGTAGLLLAAGAGRRFGGPKALALLHGQRLVDRGVGILRDGGCDDVVVVSGAVPLQVPGAEVVHNPLWDTGMGSSLRVGLSRLQGTTSTATVVLLVDTPWVGAEAVRRLRAAGAVGAVAAQATYGGVPGHPVLLARETWDDVAATATGDRGARAWLRANAGRVLPVVCDGTGHPRDADRPQDLVDD
ncbi:MAG TPA: nucleotidyltransferase family protein, partial [Actinomycetales bacterium]